MRLVEKVHAALVEVVGDGDLAIDATIGNGHDLVFLCRLVGKAGKVHGFDRQEDAHASSKRRLGKADMLNRCVLHQAGHERMREILPPETCRRTRAITFNLGFLPGSDKSVTTRPLTTIAGLKTSTEWLAPNGLLTVTAYRGHPGGKEEAQAVEEYLNKLSTKDYEISTETTSADASAPLAFLIRKKGHAPLS